MKKIFISLILILTGSIVMAQVPKTLSFQGVLMEIANGQAVQDGTNYSFGLSIFNVETGGAAIWTETHDDVVVEDGVYNLILGTGGSPLNLAFDETYYLEIKVSGGPDALAEETLSPRAQLTASGYELNPNIQDLADGELSGAKVGSGVDGANINDGSVASSKISGTIAVADGGTGAGTAANARTNLELVIGTDVQAHDADLDDLADGVLSASRIENGTFLINSTGANGQLWQSDGSGAGGWANQNTMNAGQVDGYEGADLDVTALGSEVSGTLAIGNGGTGATTATSARTNLGLGSLSTLSAVNNSYWSGTDLSVVNGGTGSSTAAGARANLGLAIGTNVQAQNTYLNDLADGSLSATRVENGSYFINSQGSNGQVWKSDGSGAGTWGTDNNTQLSEATVESYIANDVSSSYVPRDNGSKLVSGTIRDNGSNIGIGGSPSTSSIAYIPNTSETYSLNLSNSYSGTYAYGIYNYVTGGTTEKYGIWSEVWGTASSATVGVYGYSRATSPENFGLYGKATGGTNNFGVYGIVATSTSNYAGYFYGNVAYTGTISDVSDIRRKKNIETLEGSLEKILSLRGISFVMKDCGDNPLTEYGFIAQEVEGIFPNLVDVDNEGYLTLNYVGLIAPIVEAMQEQQEIIESQKSQIELLEAEIKSLSENQHNNNKRLAQIESLLNAKAALK